MNLAEAGREKKGQGATAMLLTPRADRPRVNEMPRDLRSEEEQSRVFEFTLGGLRLPPDPFRLAVPLYFRYFAF